MVMSDNDGYDGKLGAVYAAGPLFTASEREFNAVLAHELRDAGFAVFLPQEDEPRERTAAAIFAHDLAGLRAADLVVANLDGPTVDDGTAWEVGWAFAHDLPVLGYRTDFRSGEGDLAPVNVMLAEACSELLLLPADVHPHYVAELVADALVRMVIEEPDAT